MSAAHAALGRLKGQAVRGIGAVAVSVCRRQGHGDYRPGVTVVTVNWNSLPYLRVVLDATKAMSPPDTGLLVVDNASTDGSLDYLRRRDDVKLLRLPVNVGHGTALDLAMSFIDTEYVAVLDVDSFPISPSWLSDCITALRAGAQVAGGHMHRNFVHPCFLVTRTRLIHDYHLTFRSVGALSKSKGRAPLFFDVGEALSQRVILRFGGSQALYFFEIASVRGPGNAGQVFGDLVYHNLWSTHGEHRVEALAYYREAVAQYHPTLGSEE